MFSLVLLLLMLLACSAFFSASETALFSLSGVQLHRFRQARAASAAKLVESLRQPRKMLVTILLGNELVNVSISIVGAAIISRLLPLGIEGQAVAAVAIMTPLILVCGEIVPKNVAIRYAALIAPIVVWPLSLFHRLVRPLRAVLTRIADRVILLTGGRPERAEPMIMEEEFRRLVDLGRKGGAIAPEEREIIHNVFEFTDKVVADIMTPAERVFSLSIDLPDDRVIEEIRSVQYSRVPFTEGTRNRVVGILHVRDLFAMHRRRLAGEELDLRDLLHPPLFISPSTPLEQLLQEFQRTQMHMAVVRGGDGKVKGVVTMGDVLEELFGEME